MSFHPHVADSASCASCALLQPVTWQKEEEDGIIRQALAILEKRLFQGGPVFDQPEAVAEYLRLKLAAEPNEVFAVLFLDAQNRALAFEPLFRGSVNQTSVYPRVVAQRALLLNSTGIVVAHSHPSGKTDPSEADRQFTRTLRTALSVLDVRLLDHFIIGQGEPFSFSEHGLL
ncbi:MAG: Mov34/MPN/PAD-1 family protein [Zoogloeaceae bacterium]|jgi:DNA repair protein RadC|nr:Mov34/MPN/PAD-1 family protein [Zoogloeaceae bacterium]